jgi:hypothetical protein
MSKLSGARFSCRMAGEEGESLMDEEMRRTMRFILEQQAQFAANQQKHEEYLQKHEEHIQRHEENMRRHEENMRKIEESQLATSQVIAHLGNAMLEIAEAQARADARAAETDERLNNLILVVERYISGRANGNA